MSAQRLGRRVGARELRLAQRRVNLVVADLVEEHRRPALAAAELWDEVMQALARLGRNRAAAQGARRVIGLGHGSGVWA